MKKLIPFTLEEAQKPDAIIRSNLDHGEYYFVAFNKKADALTRPVILASKTDSGYFFCDKSGKVDGNTVFSIEIEVPDDVYKFGQKFASNNNGKVYMVCSVDYDSVNLIDINNGFRLLASPITAVVPNGIGEFISPEFTKQILHKNLTPI